MSRKFESREDLIKHMMEKYPNHPERWKERHCSFCGIGSNTAKGVVAGPNGVLICNECILLAYKVLNESGRL